MVNALGMGSDICTDKLLVANEAGKCRLGNGNVTRSAQATDYLYLREMGLVSVVEVQNESFVVIGKVLLFCSLLLGMYSA